MTKNGNNGPKARARARQNRDHTGYTEAVRSKSSTSASPDVTVTVTTLTFGPADPVPWEAPRTWRCHHCGTTGMDCAAAASGSYTLPDGVTYLRSHCANCLPQSEWTVATDWERACALTAAVRAGDVDGARTDLYRCSVCGGAWHIGDRVQLPCHPLYDRGTDLFEHPCPTCITSLTAKELGHAHERRAHQLGC